MKNIVFVISRSFDVSEKTRSSEKIDEKVES